MRATGPALGAMTLLHSGWGVRFMDYDNDGWKDLFIAQSHVMDTIEISEPHLRYREPPMLLWNSKGKKFVDVSARSGDIFSEKWAGRGLASGDINNDGREDVVVTSNNGPAWVLMNETETSKSLDHAETGGREEQSRWNRRTRGDFDDLKATSTRL